MIDIKLYWLRCLTMVLLLGACFGLAAHKARAEESSVANLTLKAVLADKYPALKEGVIWRVFAPSLNLDNKLPLLASSEGGEVSFNLPANRYLVMASFGRLTAEKYINLKAGKNVTEIFNFKAGGLKLAAKLLDGVIDERQVTFAIYRDNTENDKKSLLLPKVMSGEIIRLPQGSYHVLSKYGTANALKRTEVTIKAGQLTEAVIEHSAAKITLRLVRNEGGEALADTSWAISDSAGDVVWENVGAYAMLYLADGNYSVIAKNKDAFYHKSIIVTSGKDQTIDILTKPGRNEGDNEGEMDSDNADDDNFMD